MGREALQLKNTWITAVAMYRKNLAAKKILEDLLLELQERVERDTTDSDAWSLMSAVQATLESLKFYYKNSKSNYLK